MWVYVLHILGYSWCAVSVNRILVRTPKEGDIGLIFDVNIINTANNDKQTLDYRIRPNGECCVNVSTSRNTFEAGKVLGGSFGHIEPGAIKTVSLIWPTTAVFNRVGHCDVIISSVNLKNEEKEISQRIYFDTRFETIDPSRNSFTRRSDYVNCGNWDLNYFNNCAPLNCEEKYLGKRSFYNSTAKQCEEVPKCLGKDQVYDIYANECSSLISKLTTQDVNDIRHGTDDNYKFELTSRSSEAEHPAFHEPVDQYMLVHSSTEAESMWQQIINILGVVFATILFYTCVCYVVFLLVNKITKKSSRRS